MTIIAKPLLWISYTIQHNYYTAFPGSRVTQKKAGKQGTGVLWNISWRWVTFVYIVECKDELHSFMCICLAL